MDLHVLNTNFETIAVIDAYESMLWTDRYYEPGEFEIYTPVSDEMLEFPKVNNYIRIGKSPHLMIVEDIAIEATVDTGNHIRIKGRSLESILDRRFVVEEINVSGSVQNTIRSILTTNIIAPSDAARRIDNFIFEDSTDPKITELTFESQYKGKNVLEIITEICKDKEIGFKVLLNDNNQFVFSLYAGIDRSYRQEVLPWVVFKPSFENLINSNYTEAHNGAKTFCYVHAQYSESSGEASYYPEEKRLEISGSSSQIDVIRTVGSGTGLLRKEIYKEGGVSKEEGESMDSWYAKLDQSGRDELNDKKVEKQFEGELETTRMFIYDRDFFVGDVVQVANEYGMESPARMTEYTWEISSSGTNNHPTFEALDYEESEG